MVIRMGTIKSKLSMLRAICLICRSLCCRGLRGSSLSAPMGSLSMSKSGRARFATAHLSVGVRGVLARTPGKLAPDRVGARLREQPIFRCRSISAR